MITAICIVGMMCAPVVAHVGNPPAEVPWGGVTQATLQYPGHKFGTVILAHLGSEFGWAMQDIEQSQRILVFYAVGKRRAYEVISTRGYALVGGSAMRDLETSAVYGNLDVYLDNQAYPYLSLETCLPDPRPAIVGSSGSTVLGDWGRLFIKARLVEWR